MLSCLNAAVRHKHTAHKAKPVAHSTLWFNFRHASNTCRPHATSFWKQKSTVYNLLVPVAKDFVCAPSQAYAERKSPFFSMCGVLCSGRRSSMQQSLEMRASEIESESALCCVLLGLLCEQCVCVWQQHSNNSAVCCFENNFWFLVLN